MTWVFVFFLRQTLWEQGGGPRTFSVRFQVLTVSAFVPFRTPWHAMVRHGTPCASASFAPLFQVWVSWIPVGCLYIYNFSGRRSGASCTWTENKKTRNYMKLPYFCVNTLRFPHNLMCWWRKLRSFREYCMQWIFVSKLLRLSPISTVAWFVGIHLATFSHTSMVEPQMGLESC